MPAETVKQVLLETKLPAEYSSPHPYIYIYIYHLCLQVIFDLGTVTVRVSEQATAMPEI
jgi:hypothetical protein